MQKDFPFVTEANPWHMQAWAVLSQVKPGKHKHSESFLDMPVDPATVEQLVQTEFILIEFTSQAQLKLLHLQRLLIASHVLSDLQLQAILEDGVVAPGIEEQPMHYPLIRMEVLKSQMHVVVSLSHLK